MQGKNTAGRPTGGIIILLLSFFDNMRFLMF